MPVTKASTAATTLMPGLSPRKRWLAAERAGARFRSWREKEGSATNSV